MANKLLGQHFLKNKSVAQKIVDALRPERNDTIFEIGSGHGELTQPLAEACRKNGCRLLAIERDQQLVEQLSGQPWINDVEIIVGDALRFLTSKRINEVLCDHSYKIVGNIPYYLTGHLLRAIGELKTRPARCILMVQKEVAERIVARPPRMNRLAASVQFWAEAKIISFVPKRDFRPSPKVDSAIMSLDLAAEQEEGAELAANRYYAAMRVLFAQPRKTILNNLAACARYGDKGKIISVLQKMNLSPKLRPQALTIENIISIANGLP